MDRIKQIRLFVEVARARSFTVAAKRLGMSRASVTKHIVALEQNLSVLLLNRTTQHVALTEAGRILLEDGMRYLEDFEILEARVRNAENEAHGTIRVGTPPAFGENHLMPAVVAFAKAYPEIKVEMFLDDGSADLVRDGLDLSIRVSPTLKNASHVARMLIRVPQVLVASPSYLDEHGEPNDLNDLLHHNCLIHRTNSPIDTWRFGIGKSVKMIQVTGSISSNFGEVLRSSALLGAGISMHAIYMVDRYIRSGRLRVVLPDIEPAGLAVYAIYPRRNPPKRVSMFIDFMRDWFPQQASWLQLCDSGGRGKQHFMPDARIERHQPHAGSSGSPA
jgi:DNA-binding transcriptional LysR family regulator